MTLISNSEYIKSVSVIGEGIDVILTRPSVGLSDTGRLKPVIILLNSNGGTDREVSV